MNYVLLFVIIALGMGGYYEYSNLTQQLKQDEQTISDQSAKIAELAGRHRQTPAHQRRFDGQAQGRATVTSAGAGHYRACRGACPTACVPERSRGDTRSNSPGSRLPSHHATRRWSRRQPSGPGHRHHQGRQRRGHPASWSKPPMGRPSSPTSMSWRTIRTLTFKPPAAPSSPPPA